jgi:hypothetical protein
MVAQRIADCGCVVIVAPVAMDHIITISRALPKGWVIDSKLGQGLGGWFVMGSKEDCFRARRQLGIDAPESVAAEPNELEDVETGEAKEEIDG